MPSGYFTGAITSAAQSVPAKAIIPTRAARVAINSHLAFTPSPPFGKLPTTREPATTPKRFPCLLLRNQALSLYLRDAGSGFSTVAL
jgi:hypothetical protein